MKDANGDFECRDVCTGSKVSLGHCLDVRIKDGQVNARISRERCTGGKVLREFATQVKDAKGTLWHLPREVFE